MTPERWQHFKQLFDEVQPLNETERIALLDSSPEGERELIAEVLRLLDGSERAGSFLERPAGDAHRILDKAAADTAPSLALGQRLGDRFVIERFVAHGGMGEVYRAFDTELAIPVAIKTLRREFSRDDAFVANFRREVQIAREVYGEHLCRTFDIGRDGQGENSIVYLSMEFLDGPTLRDVLRQQAPLSLETALPILRDIADGMESLRRRGMVHRDLKPGNIVLVDWNTPDQRAVITDFGLARSALRSRGTSGDASQATFTSHSGKLAGTPDYMAPEQLNGKPATAATDIYAFGIVAYEMVTGNRPFGGEGWESAFLRLTVDPEPPRSYAATLPAEWEQAILACLAREADERPQSALLVTEVLGGGQPVGALRTGAVRRSARTMPWWRVAIAAAILLAAVTVGWQLSVLSWFSPRPAAGQSGPHKHIAVLPFSYSETDPVLRPYADGLMDTITRRLSQFEQEDAALLVVPSSEVRNLRVSNPADAVRRFQADYAIEGRVDSQDNRVRLTLTVVDTATMRQLETAVIEEPRDRLLNLQDGAVARLSNALNLRISETRNPDPSSSLRIDPAAYDFYLQGRGYLQRNDREDDVRHAITLFERALKIDPRYAPALAGLADAQWFLFERTRDRAWVDLAKRSAESALKVNPQLADAHITIGRLLTGTGEHETAIESFKRALEIDSRNAEALFGLGSAYSSLGQLPTAESTYLRAVSHRPSDWTAHKKLGVFYIGTGEYQKALGPLQNVVDLTPDNAQGYNNLGVALLRLGRYDEARKVFTRSYELDPRVSAITNLANLELYAGNSEESIRWNRRALSLDEKSYRAWGNMAPAYNRLNRPAEARNAYRQAVSLVEEELKVNPKSGSLLSSLAHFQAPLGLSREAIANMKKSEMLEPTDPEVWHRNAETWVLLKNDDEAVRCLREALKHGLPVDNLPPRSNLHRLKSLL